MPPNRFVTNIFYEEREGAEGKEGVWRERETDRKAERISERGRWRDGWREGGRERRRERGREGMGEIERECV